MKNGLLDMNAGSWLLVLTMRIHWKWQQQPCTDCVSHNVLVLCEQSGLPVCNQILPNSYKSLCVLWDQMYQMRRVPWSLIIAIIWLMCCVALNEVYHVSCNPYQCGTLLRVATWPWNSLSDPKWSDNAAALTAEFRRCFDGCVLVRIACFDVSNLWR